MGRFDRRNSAHESRKIQKSLQNPKFGRVVEVFEHQHDNDYSNFEVDVKVLGEEKQHRAIPYLAAANNEIRVPTVGDIVVIEFRDGEKKVPMARDAVYTNSTRPPKGNAGMWRKRIPSGTSPAGDGDLYIESYTLYDDSPAVNNPDDLTAERSYVRLAKKSGDDDDPDDGDDLPMSIELVDNPADDSADVFIRLNKEDGSDSAETWGLRFDLKTGEFKLLDASGYGIVSDGAGNFTWHHETIDESTGTTTSL